MSLVIGPDFLEHILQRLLQLELAWNTEVTRSQALTLLHLAYSHQSLAGLPPSLLALASILTSLRPGLESSDLLLVRDTPSPQPQPRPQPGLPPLERVLSCLGRVTTSERPLVLETVASLETLMAASLPPSPASSDHSPASSSARLLPSLSSSPITSRKLFQDPDKHLDLGTERHHSSEENICIASEN